ncbi:MAG: carboxypeptidase-like regulatory domain-containing protein [Myxococcota bacterium]
MTARGALTLLALLACTARARAAVIEGRITHPTRPGATAKLLVEAIGLDPDERSITRETHSDANGHYRFDDLPAPAAYLVRARYQGLSFPGGSIGFRPGETDKPQTLDFKIYDVSSDGSRLRVVSLQWVVVRSAGVWRVQQSANVANPDGTVVIVPQAEAPPIGVALAAGHSDLETFFGRLPDGVSVRGDVAEIRGPIFPGDEGFSFQAEYDLEQKGDDLVTEIAVPSAVENVAVYVQDFGVEVDAGELHPARPARQDDQIYQAFLGFDLPAGTRLPLRVHALPPAQPLSQVWVALLAALGAGALLYFVALPVIREARARGSTPSDSGEPSSPAKAALAAALHDLEHDFETGKLSPEDHERLRADLRREALGALARERLGPAAFAQTAPEQLAACSCGRVPAPADRFCAGCGKAL